VLLFVAGASLVVSAAMFVQGLRMRRLYRARLAETQQSLDELRALIKLEQHWAAPPTPREEEPTGPRKLVN
jgi:hypothetical protein